MPHLINISEAVSLGLHTMVILAGGADRRLTNAQIAEALGVSGHHLAKVMQRLVRAGLVDSVPGPQGGFLLKKPAGKIRLLDIYEVVDGRLDDDCRLLGAPACAGDKCILGEILHSLHGQLREYLGKTTLAQLAASSPLQKTPLIQGTQSSS